MFRKIRSSRNSNPGPFGAKATTLSLDQKKTENLDLVNMFIKKQVQLEK